MGNSPKGEYMQKNKNFIQILGTSLLCLFLTGCFQEEFLIQEEPFDVTLQEEMVEAEQEKGLTTQNQQENEESQTSQIPKYENSTKDIIVHICGAVKQPGVYYLKENQRLFEGIAKAGGFREDASEEYLNQAMVLEDGMKIIVPTKDDIVQSGTSPIREEENWNQEIRLQDQAVAKEDYIMSADASISAAAESGYLQKKDMQIGDTAQESVKDNARVDLNTADEALLCTLPGIGESRAKSIIAYRKEHGAFRNPEDVMKVSGIKEAAYEKIKDLIMVIEE